LRFDAASLRLSVTLHVQPNARRSAFAGLHGNALKVSIAAPAADNRANAALIEFLGEALGISRSSIAIRRGATARRKVVEISGGPEIAARLEQFATA
jgi:hypothetical protein